MLYLTIEAFTEALGGCLGSNPMGASARKKQVWVRDLSSIALSI